MSALEIRSGGAVAVDTASLREAAAALRALAAPVHELAATAGAVRAQIAASSFAEALDLGIHAQQLAHIADHLADVPEALAHSLEELAVTYDVIELRAEHALARAAGDEVAVRAVDARLAMLAADHPDAAARADQMIEDAWWRAPRVLAGQVAQATWWLPVSGAAWTAGTALLWHGVARSGAGRMVQAPSASHAAPTSVTPVPVRSSRPLPALPLPAPALPLPALPLPALPAAPVPVLPAAATAPSKPATGTTTVRATTAREPASAIASLADAARRVPGADDSRVRVERYDMDDGTTQFAVYVAGTQTFAGGDGDPFDMVSNLELYTGERSASLEAVELALRAVGAQRGDHVHAFGHSQGAMAASALALGEDFTVRTLVTFGSPVEAAVPRDVLSVGIRHLDDPVAALAGSGFPHPVGAHGSFVAERVADPAAGVHDLGLEAHGIDRYAETAAMVDSSDDPRAAALGEIWHDLGSAREVTAVEFAARRGEHPAAQIPAASAPSFSRGRDGGAG